MWPEEFRPAIIPLAAAWALVTAVAILATAGSSGSIGDAILAPLWLATGIAMALHTERDRWPVIAAAALLVVAGLARGWALLAGLDVLPQVRATAPVTDVVVFAGIALVFYDMWVQRRAPRSSE